MPCARQLGLSSQRSDGVSIGRIGRVKQLRELAVAIVMRKSEELVASNKADGDRRSGARSGKGRDAMWGAWQSSGRLVRFGRLGVNY